MASGPITSWEIDGETMETVTDYFGGLQESRVATREDKIMASGPITSWEIDGETMETVTDFIFMSFFHSKPSSDFF